MTRVKINPGVCGLQAVVDVKKDGKRFTVKVKSACAMVEKLGGQVSGLEVMDLFKRITDNPVYKSASGCVRHVSCPVPAGILKALEVEAGLALPRDARIEFISGEEEED